MKITADQRAAVVCFMVRQGRGVDPTRLCHRADLAGLAWGLLPRRIRRAHARTLHRTRTLATTWPEQWLTTLEAGRASIG